MQQAPLLTVKVTVLKSAYSRQLNPITKGQAEGQVKPRGFCLLEVPHPSLALVGKGQGTRTGHGQRQ